MKTRWISHRNTGYLNGPNGMMVHSSDESIGLDQRSVSESMAFWPDVNIRIDGDDLELIPAPGFPQTPDEGQR